MEKEGDKSQLGIKNLGDDRGDTGILTQSAGDEITDLQRLEKIRGILFGNLSERYDQELAHIEAHIQKEIAGLKDETEKRFSTLEKYIEKRFDALTDGVKAEEIERLETGKSLRENLGTLIKRMAKKEGSV